MVITTDFDIFADKYHNKQHLPDDMITMIMNINTNEIQTEIKDTHKMWNKQVMGEIHDYFGWLESNYKHEYPYRYNKETYEIDYEELFGLIEWNKQNDSDSDSDEEEEEKTFYFSYDEEGYIFYKDIESLMSNTPRMEDCHVYVGITTEERIEEEEDDIYRQVDVLEYLDITHGSG